MGFYGIYPLVIWFMYYGLVWFYRDDHGENSGILMDVPSGNDCCILNMATFIVDLMGESW